MLREATTILTLTDLEHESILPQANDGTTRLYTESDRRHGVITYACEPGALRIQVRIHGYATGTYEFVVSNEPAREPRTLEVLRAHSAVRGVVLHPDGRPFTKDPLTVYRKSATGWIDVGVERVVTNLDGEFEFPSLAPGEHVIVASGQPDDAPGIARFTASESPMEIEVHTAEGREVQFRILSDGIATGAAETHFRVTDSTGVVLEDIDRNPDMLIQPPDGFSVTLPVGRFTATVSRRGYRERQLQFDVPAGDTILVKLVPMNTREK